MTDNLADYIDLFPRFNVAVLGDLMLDRYVWGHASRISQEAPVPVVAVSRQNAVPGGAANVARNLLSLGAHAVAFGAISEDPDGSDLQSLLDSAGVDTSQVCMVKDRHTTVKTRILAGNQQVVRVDYEDTSDLSAAVQKQLLQRLEETLAAGNVQALILEDYAKGVFTASFMRKAIAIAENHHVMVSLDPHPSHPFNARGLTIMTPNRSEAFALANVAPSPRPARLEDDKALLTVGQKLLAKWAPQYLLITLGAGGMALFSRDDNSLHHIPTCARQVFDVSGAGDTVMGTIVLALLAGAPVKDACAIANAAAGVVVGRVGTSAIEADVLKNELKRV